MKKFIVTIIILVLGANISIGQNVYMEKWSFGMSYRISLSPKPRVFVELGPKIINSSMSFGKEFSFLTEYSLKENLSLRLSLGKANTYFYYFYEYSFLKDFALANNISITDDDIESVGRRMDRPSVMPPNYDFNNYSLSFIYSPGLKNKKYNINFYGGINLIHVKPNNRISTVIFVETQDTTYSLPFLTEYSINSFKLEYKRYDFGVNYGIEISRKLKNYHKISLSLGMTYFSRYIVSGDYYGLTSDGTEYKGTFIQSPTFYELRVSYLLNFGAITHYSK